MHFVYTFSPLRIMKCPEIETSQEGVQHCEWIERQPELSKDSGGGVSVGIFRGGSGGITVLHACGGKEWIPLLNREPSKVPFDR